MCYTDKHQACPTPGLKNSGCNSSMSSICAGKSQIQADHKAKVEIATPTPDQMLCMAQST